MSTYLTGYYGGKLAMRDLINALLPPHRVYVEPFGGMAAVHWIAKHGNPDSVLMIGEDGITLSPGWQEWNDKYRI